MLDRPGGGWPDGPKPSKAWLLQRFHYCACSKCNKKGLPGVGVWRPWETWRKHVLPMDATNDHLIKNWAKRAGNDFLYPLKSQRPAPPAPLSPDVTSEGEPSGERF